MKNITNNLAIAAISFLTLFPMSARAQSDFDLTSINAEDISSSDIAVEKAIFGPSVQQVRPLALKEWTIMVFMNSKNDLNDSHLMGLTGKFSQKDLDEMKEVGTTGAVNVVVEYGRRNEGSKRVLIRKKSGVFSSGETVYGEFPNADMGDYRRVIEFVRWSKTNFPARKYMLVLWNHGLGWIDPAQQSNVDGTGSSNKGILFDDETKNYVRTRQLGDILRATGYVDILTMNACLMQMAEVAYEVKDNAGLLLASEETMLAQGFDYTGLLNFMNANTAFTNEQLSDFMMSWYRRFYAAGLQVGPLTVPLTNGATLSTIRLQAMNGLPARLNAFANAVMNNNETDAAKAAIRTAVRFASLSQSDTRKLMAPYVDLYDFAAVVGQNARTQAVRQAAERLMNYIRTSLVMRSVGLNSDTVNGYDYSRVGGIAINMTMKIKPMPPALAAVSETRYSDLALSGASRWDEFVTWTDGVWRQ